MRQWILLAMTLALGTAALCLAGQTVTDQTAANLAASFTPQQVLDDLKANDDLSLLDNPLSQMQCHDRDGSFCFNMGYKELHFPADAKTYVIVYWVDRSHQCYWRLFASSDGQNFQLVQDSRVFYSFSDRSDVWFATADLDGDGVAEVLFQQGGGNGVTGMFVFAWRGSRLVLISPLYVAPAQFQQFQDANFVASAINSDDNAVVLQDLDGDGKAEIIAYPDLWITNVRDEDGTYEKIPTPSSPTRIFKLDATGVYKLWKEISSDDPYPVSVPGIAVIHPGTIPLSELSSPGQGQLRVFVSHPAGTTYTVDDFVQTGFTLDLNRTVFEFKQRWDNQKFPDLTQGNRDWMGVPVRQEARAKQGVWTVNPSDPTYPSPDPAMEFHFLGPYLELRVGKSALYPNLLQRATADFARDPAKTSTYIEVPISGKMKDGKLAAIGAIVCVTRTGSGK